MDVTRSSGFQIGDHNQQINHFQLGQLTINIVGAEVDAAAVERLRGDLPRLLELGLRQRNDLDAAGVDGGVTGPVLPTGRQDARPWEIVPTVVDVAGAGRPASTGKQFDRSFDELSAYLADLDGRISGSIVQVGSQGSTVDVVDLLLRQGNLALWRFRAASARLFGEEVTALFRARLDRPAPPEVAVLQQRASVDVEVLRGLALLDTGLVAARMAQQPAQFPFVVQRLAEGGWSQVLDLFEGQGLLDAEAAAHLRTQVAAIGQPYDPAEVKDAVKQAKRALRSALARDPSNTAALANLATVLAESALFDYLAQGKAKRERLAEAAHLFARADEGLAGRTDAAGLTERARCVLAAAVQLPAQAVLESVPEPATYTQLVARSLSTAARGSVRWDVFQRTQARRYADFFDETGIAQAGDLFTAAGDHATAAQCRQMLLMIQQGRANRGRLAPWAASIWPVLGNWAVQGGNAFLAADGRLAFDVHGFTAQLDVGPSPVGGPRRLVLSGAYQVQGGAIQVQGLSWTIPMAAAWGPPAPMPQPMVMPPTPFTDQLAVQSVAEDFLALVSLREGLQLQCRRL